jgi:predicted O-linked N-acetylglucosamine transferase (SPINDLY family)
MKAGRRDEASDQLSAAIAEDPAQTAQVYRSLLVQLYQGQRYAEGEALSAGAVERHPRDIELWNLRGVILRRMQRYGEALEALDQAARLNPKALAPLMNRGNVCLDMGDLVQAEAIFTKLVRLEPRNAEHQRMLGRALARLGKRDAAAMRFRQAASLKKDYVDALLDLAGVLHELHRDTQAMEALDRGIAIQPDLGKLHEAKAVLIRRRGELRKAEAYLLGIMPRFENEAWLHYQLGGAIADYDRGRGNMHLRRAVELAPDRSDYRMGLIESIERTRTGDEGANIEEAYGQLKALLAAGRPETPAQLKVAAEVLIRVCDFDELETLGAFTELGRAWAGSGRHTALLKQLARVRTPEDRLELVEQHRIWGRLTEQIAADRPISRPPPRPADGRIRLGFMSSDLRRHPVAYFALPLFEHIDERFDIYCYSFFQGREDPLQQHIAERVKAYRWNPDISPRDAAEMIAADQLDMLIELGGSTHMNKLEVMAWRPAPVQASWLGYPHSAGLSTIDYFVCDPYSAPARPELLIETPLVMPKSWIALGRMIFSEEHEIAPGLPEDRAGRLTFGTANNPHKYNRGMFALWSRVLAKTPGSRFVFVRPEGGTASFRANVTAQFAAHGVAPERIEFRTVRGRHMPFYNEIDITLDTMPLTGGTTTTEALWMGVPVVSLIGEAFFERLSYSILSNCGAGDLAAADPDRFVEIALELAADRERRLDLRQNLRRRMKAGPLGDTDAFARDFYDMAARAVAAAGARVKATA